MRPPSPSLSLPESSGRVASRMGDEGLGIVSISDNVRCFKIGFEGVRVPLRVGRSIPNRSSVVATFIGRTGSTAAVCSGPYSHVTSESFSLR